MNAITYKCPECDHYYLDRKTAKKCAAFCKKYKACNMEITKHAVKIQGRSSENKR